MSRSNIEPNPEPPASSPLPSTIISQLAIGDSTSPPWATTTMTNQASWPLISPSPFSSSSSCLQHSRCCPPSTVRPNHLSRIHTPLNESNTNFPSVTCYPAKSQVSGCQCGPCVDQRARIRKRERGSLLRPRMSKLYVACWHFSEIGSVKRLA